LPIFAQNIEQESFPCHAILPGIASRSSEEHNFLLGNNRHCVTEACLRDLSVHFNLLNERILFRAFEFSLVSAAVIFIHKDVSSKIRVSLFFPITFALTKGD
jgi:hypothetical protein